MRLFNRFSVVPFHFILTVTLLFVLPSGVLALGGGKDQKAVQKTSASAGKKDDSLNSGSAKPERLNNPNKLKGQPDKNKDNNDKEVPADSYPANCAEDAPDCADKLHPETTQLSLPVASPEHSEQNSESWWDSLLKSVGIRETEAKATVNFVPGPATECPDGYKSLGGNFLSDPTVTTFKDRVYVFARGTDNALYYLVLEKNKNNKWVSLGCNSISNPGSYFNDKGLFVEVTGIDGQRYYRSTTDGVTFADWTPGTVNARTTNGKAGVRGSALTFVKGQGENPPLCYLVEKTKKNTPANNGNGKANGNSAKKAGNGSVSTMMAPSEGGCDWWDPWCEPPPSGDQYSPIGSFDSIDTNAKTINGWSYDPDNPDVANDVYIYIDGAGYSATANLYHPNVPGYHSFSFQIPAQYTDGQQHTVIVYGVDTGSNPWSTLNGSPKYFTINPPVQPPNVTPTEWRVISRFPSLI